MQIDTPMRVTRPATRKRAHDNVLKKHRHKPDSYELIKWCPSEVEVDKLRQVVEPINLHQRQ